ncbi:MAG: hypothetical protein LBC61_00055 [Candidatus Peribacteria bacterium]|jgi:hypothetical protein|nr:hypothetical protein [Candidatus Peribacteria bacterium]
MSIESLGKKITEKAQKKMSQSILKISNGLSFFTGVMSTIEILYEILLETIIFFTKGERDFSDKFYILQQYAK